MKIAILSCTKKKLRKSCEAYKLYSESALFRKTYRRVQKLGYDQVYILSAKYGLLHPYDIIEPYELSLRDLTHESKQAWTSNVWRRLELYGVHQIDFWCGELYYKDLLKLVQDHYPEIEVNIPMQGMGIGQRLAFLTDDKAIRI